MRFYAGAMPTDAIVKMVLDSLLIYPVVCVKGVGENIVESIDIVEDLCSNIDNQCSKVNVTVGRENDEKDPSLTVNYLEILVIRRPD